MKLPSRRAVLLAILVLLLATLIDDRVVPTDVPARSATTKGSNR